MTTPQVPSKPKKPIYKRWWFIAIVAIFVIGGISKATGGGSSTQEASGSASQSASSQSADKSSGESKAAKKEEASKKEESSKKEEAPKAQQEEAVEVSADTLLEDYKNNELAADKKYKGKTLRVSGTVSQVTDVLGQKALSVDNGGEYELNSVYCILKKDQLDKAASLNKGDQVTVVGKNDGYNQINVTLKNCTISQ